MVKQSAVIRVLTGALALVVSGPAFATDCAQPGNLVPNCGFQTDLALWYFTADSQTHIPGAGGASTPGAAELNRHDGVGAIEAFSACISASPNTSYSFGASFRLPSGTGVFGCTVDVVRYSDVSCGAFESQSHHSFNPVFEWSEITGGIATGATVASVQIRMACFSSSEFVIRIDDFLFGQGLNFGSIFADGFESGDTQAWSIGEGLDVGRACTVDSECATGFLCCYPCGVPGCRNECTIPVGGFCPVPP